MASSSARPKSRTRRSHGLYRAVGVKMVSLDYVKEILRSGFLGLHHLLGRRCERSSTVTPIG